MGDTSHPLSSLQETVDPDPPTSSKALTALVLGVLAVVGLGPVTGIPAIIIGNRAKREVRANQVAAESEPLDHRCRSRVSRDNGCRRNSRLLHPDVRLDGSVLDLSVWLIDYAVHCDLMIDLARAKRIKPGDSLVLLDPFVRDVALPAATAAAGAESQGEGENKGGGAARGVGRGGVGSFRSLQVARVRLATARPFLASAQCAGGTDATPGHSQPRDAQ